MGLLKPLRHRTLRRSAPSAAKPDQSTDDACDDLAHPPGIIRCLVPRPVGRFTKAYDPAGYSGPEQRRLLSPNPGVDSGLSGAM